MALQRKNRNVRRNDDEHRKQRRAANFIGGVDDDAAPFLIGHVLFAFGQPVQYVFDHDDRTVHNNAEVHRTQTEQVGRHPHDFQPQKG